MTDEAANAGLASLREHFPSWTPVMTAGRSSPSSGRAWEAAVGRGENTDRLRDEASRLLAELSPLEDFFAYPGLRLRRTVHEHVDAADAGLFASLARRVNASLSSGVYRHDSSQWEPGEEGEVTVQGCAADWPPRRKTALLIARETCSYGFGSSLSSFPLWNWRS